MISDEELAVMKYFPILLLLAIMCLFLLKFDDFFSISVLVLVMTDQVQATVQQVPIPVSRLPASKTGIWNRVSKIWVWNPLLQGVSNWLYVWKMNITMRFFIDQSPEITKIIPLLLPAAPPLPRRPKKELPSNPGGKLGNEKRKTGNGKFRILQPEVVQEVDSKGSN